jgi:hypothetical protein
MYYILEHVVRYFFNYFCYVIFEHRLMLFQNAPITAGLPSAEGHVKIPLVNVQAGISCLEFLLVFTLTNIFFHIRWGGIDCNSVACPNSCSSHGKCHTVNKKLGLFQKARLYFCLFVCINFYTRYLQM